jgi:hypothetical protein
MLYQRLTFEIAQLYGLRVWVVQSYKQIKYGLGRSDNQLRSDVAMRRQRGLVFCAFTFWWCA